MKTGNFKIIINNNNLVPYLAHDRDIYSESLKPTQVATGGAMRDMWFLWESNPGLAGYTIEPQTGNFKTNTFK